MGFLLLGNAEERLVSSEELLGCLRHPRAIPPLIRRVKRFREVKAWRPSPLRPNCETEGIVVSLTSYGARLDASVLAIKSIFAQTWQPEAVHLWLDTGLDRPIPRELRELETCGLVIHEGVEDLRPHKKYFFAMRQFPNLDIITIDDDVVYPADTIESLCRARSEHPSCVCARRVNRIRFADGGIAPYDEWDFEWTESTEPRRDLLATGVGGVLYPRGVLRCNPLFDSDAIRAHALGCDDVWLKAVEAGEGVKVAWADNACPHPYTVPGTQATALFNVNAGAGGLNDATMRSVMAHFGLTAADFFEGGDADEA